ncbi:S8 family peptidase [Kribbella sp. NPDC051770]|uniref:S8 family peptidase n=1 Tax=Kribbella sp. NPDC051770 TaxID=3155413 RepID=UPI0034189F42
MRKRPWTILLAALMLLTLTPIAAESAPPPERSITLITGDKVVLRAGDQLSVVRASGREKIGYESRRTAGGWTVIPYDVRSAVESGRLDRRLFDIDLLLRDGYDDAARADIPLIITGASRQATSSGTALSVLKENAADFLERHLSRDSRPPRSVDDPSGLRAGGVKIWLDGKLHPSLDHSVPQIGAPAAWQAGYTGKGITVAVLDTGIDATHPDLTGQVVAAKNFTTDPSADVVGHGTHVASTIAGKGAAPVADLRAGKGAAPIADLPAAKGVAPDAKLLDGKVCDDFGGCAESDVLAGIDWAVAQKAKVVNLSLGGSSLEGGLLDQAVNRLTQQTGILFVVTAGNNGRTVESPGTAAAALTVGAVDRDENLAGFSAPGPVAAGAVKPDVTAPGVGIVAARSSASHPQDPVGDRHARMSGTSMATPHVSGAAALLAQQHPTWKAAELKATLTSTARANPALTPYQQGSGRIDVTRAITQTVVATTTSVSFGTTAWPHTDDKPVTKQVSFQNLSAIPVTLDLTATLKQGTAPAPLTLSTNHLTLPANGQAAVQLTSNTNHQGPDGLYTGTLTATTGTQKLTVPLVADKEVESYNLTLTTLGPDGKPLPAAQVYAGLVDLNTLESRDPGRVPKGSYALDVTAFGPAGEHYRMVQPALTVDRDLHLTVDLRKAKPVKLTVPRADARTFVVFFGYEIRSPSGAKALTFNLQPEGDKLYLGRLGNPTAPDRFQSFVSSYVGKLAADGSLTGTPYLYGLVDTRRGQFFDGLQRRIFTDRQLAHVVTRYQGTGESNWALVGRRPGVDTLPIAAPVQLPSTVHQFLEPDTDWQQMLGETQRDPRQYKAGTTTYETLTTGER